MRTLGGIKLNQLSKEELENRELKALVGGCQHHCCCRNIQDYPDNKDANFKLGLHVVGGYAELFINEYGDSTTYSDFVVKP